MRSEALRKVPHVVLAIPAQRNAKGIPIEDQVPFARESLALAYLSAALMRARVAVTIVDGYAERLDEGEMARRLGRVLREDSILCLSLVHSALEPAGRLVSGLRQSGFTGRIVAGGWEPTLADRPVMELIPGIDVVLRGEAEDTLVPLCQAIAAGDDLSALPGVAVRSGDAIVLGRGTPLAPAFALSGRPYHYWFEQGGCGPMPIQSSRGCVWGKCTFCTTPAVEGLKTWRFRPVASLIDEMKYGRDTYGVRDFVFVDDEFLGPSAAGLARAAEFATAMAAADLGVNFTIDCRVPDYRAELFAKLRRCGLNRVFIGIESGSAGMLRTMKKGYVPELVEKTLVGLRALDIEVIPGFIVFEPYMQLEDVKATIDFLLDKVGYATPTKFLNRLVPYVGTAVHSQLIADGLLVGEYPDLSFRFRDPRVDRLYGQLKQELAAPIETYRTLCREQGAALRQTQQLQDLVQICRTTFDTLCARVSMESSRTSCVNASTARASAGS